MSESRFVRPTHVYVVAESTVGPCKIGIAERPEKRLCGIQCGNPRALSLVHIEASPYAEQYIGDGFERDLARRRVQAWARDIERAAHKELGAHALRGEWFDVDVEAAVAAVTSAAVIAMEVQRG